MSQHDLDIANQGFPATRSDLNLALKALGSSNSGASAPSTTYANQLWYDTANNILKIRNEDNDAWISLLTLDQSADAVTQIDVDNIRIDGNTISSTDTNGDITLDPNGTGDTIISSGNVGIATASPDSPLHVIGDGKFKSSGEVKIRFQNDTTGTGSSDGSFVGLFNGSDGMALYNYEATPMRFFTSNSERVRIDSSGNVGIGTTSPQSNINSNSKVLNLKQDSTNGSGVVMESSNCITEINVGNNASYFYNYTSDPMVFGTGNTERMRLSSAGDFQVSQNGTVNTSGTVSGVNISAQYGAFQANFHGNDYPVLNIHTSGANNRYLDFRFGNSGVGSISTNGSTTSYNTSSDYRLKEAVVDMTGAIDRVKALAPKRFNFIVDPDTTVDGFIAHEAQTVVPEAITGIKDAMMDEDYVVNAATGDIYTPAAPATYDEDGEELTAATDEVIHSSDAEKPEELADGQQWRETTAAVMGTRSVPDYQGIDQSKLVPLLVGALKESIAKIESLETRVAALEA